jgi:hypothetical protein
MKNQQDLNFKISNLEIIGSKNDDLDNQAFLTSENTFESEKSF